MDYVRKIVVNVQIREIAALCAGRLNGKNYELIEQLFESRVRNLFAKELPAFQEAEPNFKDLIVWFWKYVRVQTFTKRLAERN